MKRTRRRATLRISERPRPQRDRREEESAKHRRATEVGSRVAVALGADGIAIGNSKRRGDHEPPLPDPRPGPDLPTRVDPATGSDEPEPASGQPDPVAPTEGKQLKEIGNHHEHDEPGGGADRSERGD